MPVTITNAPRDYAWGSPTLLAELTGRVPTGAPEAEVWFGDHPSDPAEVSGGSSLADLTECPLPFLLKLLAADEPLSVQVHPTKAQAEAGFAGQGGTPGGNYVDDNHKPELIVALSETFEALCGLSPIGESIAVFESLPQHDGVRAVLHRLRELEREGTDDLGAFIAWALAPEAAIAVADVCRALAASKSENARVSMLARIAQRHPGDGGVIVAGIMNFVVLRRGEALFLDAGILHAYLAGLGVEIMAASDNVLRGGLTAKRVDVPELLAITHAKPTPVRVLPPGGSYPVPVPDFTLERVEVRASEPLALDGGAPAIVLATAGEVRVSSSAGEATAHVGEAVYLGESESARAVTTPETATIFVASTKLV